MKTKKIVSGKKLAEMSVANIFAAVRKATPGALRDAKRRLVSEFDRVAARVEFGNVFVVPDSAGEAEDALDESQDLADRVDDVLAVAKKMSCVFNEIEEREPSDG